ncbi:MAG: hypothetical protein DWQ19_12275 [Crenarchaeota archaeon]|nr:MAG: hypothetical protein DWQ19_12275 [Thermoproteota archaeon]
MTNKWLANDDLPTLRFDGEILLNNLKELFKDVPWKQEGHFYQSREIDVYVLKKDAFIYSETAVCWGRAKLLARRRLESQLDSYFLGKTEESMCEELKFRSACVIFSK